jgi:CheY-like chemotaxis protein
MANAVVALVTDLIFSTKITSTARQVGVDVRAVKSEGALAAALDALCPSGVLVDMNADGVDALAAIGVCRSHESGPQVIAFLSHVQKELAQQAEAAGAHRVMPRSAFSAELPQLLDSFRD